MSNKTLAITYTRNHAAKLVSLMRGLRSGKDEIVVVAFDVDAQRKLRQGNIPFKPADDYLTKESHGKVTEKSFSLAKKWHSPKYIEQAVSYRGINLGALVEYEFTLFLAEIMRSVEIINRAIELEKPDRILAVDDKDPTKRIPIMLGDLKRIPVLRIKPSITSRLSHYLLRDSIPVTTELARRLVTFKIPRRFLFSCLKRLIDLVGKTWVGLARPDYHSDMLSKTQSYSGKRNRILMLDFNVLEHHWLITELRRKNELLLINERRPLGWCYGALKFLLEHNIPYRTLPDYNNKETRRHVALGSSSLRNRLRQLGNRRSFKAIFSYDGIPLWELVKARLSDIFSTCFSEKIEYIETVRRAISTEKVDIILTWNPVLEFEKTAIMVANSVGVPSLVIQHGVTGHPIGFVPLVASKMAVWGEISKTWLVRVGAPADKLVITGNPKFDEFAGNNVFRKERIYRELGTHPSKGLIVLATQPIFGVLSSQSENEGELVLRSVLKAVRKFPRKQLVIKLHPTESGEVHRDLAKAMKANVIITKNVNLYELLNACEVLITISSTVALEAMALGKPVITINLTSRPDPYSESGAAIGVRRQEDIVPAIRNALYNEKVKKELEKAREKFVYDYSYKQDGQASARIMHLVDQMIEQSRRNRTLEKRISKNGVK